MSGISRAFVSLVLLAVTLTACSGGNAVLTPAPKASPTVVAASPTASAAATTPPPNGASPSPSASGSAAPTSTASATPSPMPTPTMAVTASPTATASPSTAPTANVLSDGGFEAEGAANMTLSSWSKCSYAHPVAEGTAAATPTAAIADGSVTADVISAGSPSFTVGTYPGPTSTSTPYATVTPLPYDGSYAALVFTGTGAIAETFAPNPGPEGTPVPAGVNGICQSFVVPQNGMLTAYVEEGGYETASTATSVYGDQEADIFAGTVSSVPGEAPMFSLFNELNTQKTSGYVPAYVEKGPYDLISLGLTPGQTVTLFFGTFDTEPSQKYGEYMFVDDVSVSGTPTAPMARPRVTRFTTR